MIHNAIHATRIFSTSITCSFQQELAHEFCGDNQYLGSLRPQTAIQWHRACYFLWGTILARGAQFSFGGHKQRFGGQGPGMSPVASGLLQLYSNFIKIKKGICPEMYAKFHEIRCGSTCKNYEKTVLAHEFYGDKHYFASLRPRFALQ